MNNQLSRNALIIYLRNVRTLEFIRHECRKSIDNIRRKERDLEYNLNTAKNSYPKEACRKPVGLISRIIINIFLYLFPSALIIIAIWILGAIPAFAIFDNFNILTILSNLCLVLYPIIIIIGSKHNYDIEKTEYYADQQRFANETRQYNNNVGYYETKLYQFKPKAQKYINILNTYIRQIDNMLQKEYNLNIVPKQFRDIYGVTYLYDFLSTSHLSLSDAVLNYQLDRIKSQLDTIISKCDEIIGQMKSLNSNMNEIRRQNNQLLQEAKNISYNAELSAQYSQITATNSAVALELQKKQLAYQEIDFWLNKV